MTSSASYSKAELRKTIRAALERISPGTCSAASAKACALLKRQAIWNEAQTILFFAPLPEELDVWPLLGKCLAVKKICTLPAFDAATQTYSARRVVNLAADITTGKFGVREPVPNCAEIPLARFDLILVPGLAFDLYGRRLGRGRGFYDRLLAVARGTKCGVAFDEQIVSEVPAGPQDVRVNCLLTPTRWLEAKAAVSGLERSR
jgi:5-formyltetrahydrofolate cyclo-ligase